MPIAEAGKQKNRRRNAFVRQTLECNVARPGGLDGPRGFSSVCWNTGRLFKFASDLSLKIRALISRPRFLEWSSSPTCNCFRSLYCYQIVTFGERHWETVNTLSCPTKGKGIKGAGDGPLLSHRSRSLTRAIVQRLRATLVAKTFDIDQPLRATAISLAGKNSWTSFPIRRRAGCPRGVVR